MFVHSRSLETAILVHVWIPFRRKGMERKEQARIYRKLYGYRSASNYGKYHYNVKGLLDSIPAIRYKDGNFIVRKEDFPVIQKFLDDNRSSYRTWSVEHGDEEDEKLKLHSV
jgi:hypothetical protein